MLNKKILNFLLNVRHTVVDNVKIFDDDSIVFYVHPTKGEQCRCGICGRKAPYYDADKVVWVAPGHGKETLTKFFELLSEKQRATIQLVSADGAK